MAQLDPQLPTKIYRGTVDEVFSHRNEIPPDATLELKIFEHNPPLRNEEADPFGGKSVIEAFPDLFGTVQGGPTDLSEHPEKYMKGFGETKDRRTLES